MDRAKRNRIKRRKKHQRKAGNLPNKGGVSDARRAEGKRESLVPHDVIVPVLGALYYGPWKGGNHRSWR